MNRGQPVISNPQSAKLMQPRDGTFHHPAGLAQMAAMRSATPGKLMPDSPVLQDLPMLRAVVRAVGLHTLRLCQWASPLALDRRHAIEQRNELRDVMPIGLGQDDVDRQALRLDEQVVFASRLAAIGFGPVFFPRGRHAPTNCRRPREKNRAGRRRAAWSAARGAAGSTRPPFATHAAAANRSCPSRSPSLAAAFPRECPTAKRTGCQSARAGRPVACDPDASCVAA